MRYLVYTKYRFDWVGLIYEASDPEDAVRQALRKMSLEDYETLEEVRVVAVEDMPLSSWRI